MTYDINEKRLAARSTDHIKSLVKEFIALLDIVEESDEGRLFRPNKISSCRAMDGDRMGKILVELKRITHEG